MSSSVRGQANPVKGLVKVVSGLAARVIGRARDDRAGQVAGRWGRRS
jgi:hypothetical protein